ncbi:hypothetical protein K470DRAFT_103353 [Piedraia hortae CBS 480.64]|uniref:Meiotically up-regulated gene 190 protein n=1 Tax=Piedraia hortae CBS 480.64 TaxID=1314780 RepID=A0A6A7CA52_9PEZI|nr:hypothetical protein K470DRAFT_103353 [Piedraia hortae CBS 480.64]
MSTQEELEYNTRHNNAAYTPRNPIPTVKGYREEQKARHEHALTTDSASSNADTLPQYGEEAWWQDNISSESHQTSQNAPLEGKTEGGMEDTTEISTMTSKHHKLFKKDDRKNRRRVTDPVTHLPVHIRDFTDQELKDASRRPVDQYARLPWCATGSQNKKKSDEQLRREAEEIDAEGEMMGHLFPPPEFDQLKRDLERVWRVGFNVGLGGCVLVATGAGLAMWIPLVEWVPGRLLIVGLAAVSMGLVVMGAQSWTKKRIDGAWEDEVWLAKVASEKRAAKAHKAEPVVWLNSLLHSIWPLVNPDLFASLADTLEDVMQASLPKMVRMVSVDDIAQGNESIRILGVRWLPTGAATRSVSSDGKLKPADKREEDDDGKVPGQFEVDGFANDEGDKNKPPRGDGTQKDIAEGMEAEEGDFINLEISFALRVAKRTGRQGMHLYLAFYLPGRVKIPVWVQVRGAVGTMRMRLQLAPDPPFLALATITMMGQPRIEIGCTPLIKHGLNIMDMPLISNFVQSSIDAAVSQYVAPKSMTLDLHDLLAGDDFKKDTNAYGVLVVHINRGFDFRMGDPSIPLIKKGGADPYVSVGWAKFGKAMWSTRIMKNEMDPRWVETTYLLVTSKELDVGERLRIQLWDADRFTADDDLGRIELDLEHIMKGKETRGRIQRRTDGFRALKAEEEMPGKLEWGVGYFGKVHITDDQLAKQTFDPDIRTWQQLKGKVEQQTERKLREAMIKEQPRSQDEFDQQKEQEMKKMEDAMIISAPPPDGFSSGILSIQIHQITGLELQTLHERDNQEDNGDDHTHNHPPSSYCTVIINHHKTFRTRTKPRNASPYFNAGVERYIGDWQNAEVYVSVRDSRVQEDSPLLGIVHLPLRDVFKTRSHVNKFYPIVGGVGHGRVRISMVWRSIQLRAPPNELGWDYGTLEVMSDISATRVPDELKGTKMRLCADIGKGKMYFHDNVWTSKRNSVKLPVKKRYASCLAVQFRKHGTIHEKTEAFAVLWLRALTDEEKEEFELIIWKGDFDRAVVCCQEEYGKRIGSIRLKLKFWAGLGSAHSRWVSKQDDIRDIIEVLSCARDNMEEYQTAKDVGIVDEEASDSSDEDSSDHEKINVDGGGESKQNILQAAQDYKRHMKSEHRRHRGVMQWKLPRQAQYAVHKVEQAGHKASEVFRLQTRGGEVETEV